MTIMRPRLFAIIAVGLMASGCATTPDLQALRAKQHQWEDAAKATTSPVTEVRSAYVPFKRVRYVAPGDAVTLHAHNLPLSRALQAILPAGWSLAFDSSANPNQKVNVSLYRTDRFEAIRRVALAGGYVTVVSHEDHQVTVASRATYYYRVPTSLMSGDQAHFNVASSSSTSS